jgi:hypothetical protein
MQKQTLAEVCRRAVLSYEADNLSLERAIEVCRDALGRAIRKQRDDGALRFARCADAGPD